MVNTPWGLSGGPTILMAYSLRDRPRLPPQLVSYAEYPHDQDIDVCYLDNIAVPRSLASAASPALSGAMFIAGWLAAPLIACGVLKIVYDLTIWRAFRRVEAAG